MSALPYTMSRDEVALRLGISYRQVSRFLAVGDLQCAPKLGKRVRVLTSSVLKLEVEGPGWNRPTKKKAPKRNLGASEEWENVLALPV